MEINKPYLFIEINDNNFIFFVVQYNDNFDYEVVYKDSIKSEGITNGKIIDQNVSSKILKDKLNFIEKKINYTFKNATIISDQDNYNCINASGFKKLKGSQILDEDISHILNNVKKLITDNEPDKSLIHLFNTSYILDKNILSNLPIGLHGDFYNHHLTFFLLPKNDIKNLKLVLNSCHLEIERIILKPFVQGLYEIKKNKNSNNLFLINLKKNKTNISIFNNFSFIFSQNFKFGTNIIMKDVSKLCSLDLETVKDIFEEINFNLSQENNEDKYLSEKYFKSKGSRKISLSHLENIIKARIDELISLIYDKNINIKDFKEENKTVYIFFEDKNIFNNFKKFFQNCFSENHKVVFKNITQDEQLNSCLASAELIGKGWEKEAIPVIHTKKSLISRIFSNIFK